MPELAIVPGVPGAEPYVELGESAQGRVFRKHLITINKTFLHPKTGRPITLGEDAWRQMKDSFDTKRIIQQPVFTLADENNRHSESPLNVAGLVTALEREGDRVVATIDVKDPAVAERIADGRLPGASAMLALDAKDPQTAERAGAALLHVCGTLRPALVDLGPYESVVAACGPAFETMPDGSVLGPQVLMLCQSEVDPVPLELAEPDYQHEPDYRDYGGAAGMDEDFLRGEAARLGLLAYQVSSGRGSKLEYGLVITDRDRNTALSAEAEITDEEIIGATRELAERHQVSFSAVSMMSHDGHIRAGLGHDVRSRARVLGEVAVALSRGRLEVDDEQIVSLSQARRDGEDEILRLTSSDEASEDMFGLARHPSKAGRKLTTKGRAHAPDEEDATTEDPDAAIARYLKMHAEEWGKEALHAGSHGTTSYPPKSAAQREDEEKRAQAGRPAGRSIGDLAAGSARTRHGH